MLIRPEVNEKNKKENKELKVNGYIGECWADCHVYFQNKSSKNGCGWDWTAYKAIGW